MVWVDLTLLLYECLILLQTLPANFLPPQLHQTPHLVTFIFPFVLLSGTLSYTQLTVTSSETLVLRPCCLTRAVFWSPPPPPLTLCLWSGSINTSPVAYHWWNWLFVLLCLHKELEGAASNPNAPHITSWTCSCGRTTGLLTVWKD